MFLKKMKQASAMILAGILMVSLTACGGGNNNNNSDEKPESGSAKVKEEIKAVEDGVTLPDNFDQMMYPLSALTMEVYYLGNPYYVQFADDSSRDSFWYSAALTAYYLNKEEGWDNNVSDEQFEMIISSLYASYQQGNLEFPDIREGCKYAAYSDSGEGYIFSTNDQDYVIDSLDNYSLTITDCVNNDQDYIITSELKDTDSGELLGTYQYEVVSTEYPGEDNIFSYSVAAMKDLNAADSSDSEGVAVLNTEEGSEKGGSSELTGEETTSVDGEKTDGENEENDGESDESSPEETPDNYQEESNDTDPDVNEGGSISQEDAQARAESYYGSDVSCSFAGMESIDGYEYYKFSVQGDGISKPYILVSTYGDVMAAGKNSDGSWSFDQ